MRWGGKLSSSFVQVKAGVLHGLYGFHFFFGEIGVKTAFQFSDQKDQVNGIEVQVFPQPAVRVDMVGRQVEPPANQVDDAALQRIGNSEGGRLICHGKYLRVCMSISM